MTGAFGFLDFVSSTFSTEVEDDLGPEDELVFRDDLEDPKDDLDELEKEEEGHKRHEQQIEQSQMPAPAEQHNNNKIKEQVRNLKVWLEPTLLW